MTTVLKPGSNVQIGNGELVDGIIQHVILGDGYVQYEVIWWSGNDRIVQTVMENEVKITAHSEQIKIGFAQ
jgi:hypothetical protein